MFLCLSQDCHKDNNNNNNNKDLLQSIQQSEVLHLQYLYYAKDTKKENKIEMYIFTVVHAV